MTECITPCVSSPMMGLSWWKKLGFGSPCECACEAQKENQRNRYNRVIQVLEFHNRPIIRKNLEIKTVSHYKFIRKHERVLRQIEIFASGQTCDDYDENCYSLIQPSYLKGNKMVYIVKERYIIYLDTPPDDETDDEYDEDGDDWVINSRNWDDFPIQVREDFKQIYLESKGEASFIDWEHFAPFNQYQQYRKNYLQNIISQRDTEKYLALRDHKPSIPDELSNLILSYL